MLAALESTHEHERRLLADASHELRTPLTSLTGNIDYLAVHGASVELITDLRHDAARLRRLVDDLLALEREGATSPANGAVDLAKVVNAAAAGRERVEVVAPRGVIVPGDAETLQRAVTNLIENALIHGPPDGHVKASVHADADFVEISVTDEGAGIPDGAQEAAFERFWRGSDAGRRPGSGLGLAIVRATAERHRGSVRVAGATVTIVLPQSATTTTSSSVRTNS
jgi:two-component system sensor histidine kinase MprB